MEGLMATGGIYGLIFFTFLNIILVGIGVIVAKHLDKKNENR